MRGDGPRLELLGFGRRPHEPRHKVRLLDERAPLARVPDDVLGRTLRRRARLTAQQDDNRIGFGGDEAEQEDVLAVAGPARDVVSQRVQLDLLVPAPMNQAARCTGRTAIGRDA